MRRVVTLAGSLVQDGGTVEPSLDLCVFDCPVYIAWFAGEGLRQAQQSASDLDTEW